MAGRSTTRSTRWSMSRMWIIVCRRGACWRECPTRRAPRGTAWPRSARVHRVAGRRQVELFLRHQDPQQDVEREAAAREHHAEREDQPPYPGRRAGDLRDAAADAAQPAIAEAAAELVERAGRRARARARQAVEDAGLGTRELLVGEDAALMQVGQLAEFVAVGHGVLL